LGNIRQVRQFIEDSAQKSDRMIYLFIVVHVFVCLFLIAVILLQQGKSADLAGAFGGQGSQTAFGPRSAANLLTRTTSWCAVVFMITSIGLTILMQKHAAHQHSVLSGTPATQSKPAKK
jgi:preprotein translocase subunit SecG